MAKFSCPRNFPSKFALFWDKEYYISFDDSRTEYRANLIRLLRMIISLIAIGFMIIVFPFQPITLVHVVALPSCLVFNFIACSLLLKDLYKKYRKYYITFLFILCISLALELAVAGVNSFNGFKISLIGLNVGLIFSTLMILEFPMTHLLTVSVIFATHVIYRAHALNIEQPVISDLTIIFLLAMINCFYLRHEILKYDLWKLLKKKLEQHSRFQKLIKVFPNQIVLLNEDSWLKKEFIYCNDKMASSELKASFPELGKEKSFNEYSESFYVEELFQASSSLANAKRTSSSFERKTLNFLIDYMFKENKHNGEFSTAIASKGQPGSREILFLDSDKIDKFEIKIGWINWGEEDVLLLLFNDISIVDEIRHLKKLHQNKDKLLGSISHELRTPLNGIIGMIDVSEDELGENCANVKNYLNIARSSAKMLFFLINNILDMALIQRGTLEVKNVLVSLKSLVEPVVQIISVEIKNKGLQFLFESEIDGELLVFVEPIRFQQILVNLLKNACKFTQKGRVKFSVRIVAKDLKKTRKPFEQIEAIKMKENSLEMSSSVFGILRQSSNHNSEYTPPTLVGKAVFSVEDTGEGIRSEDVDKIFSFMSKNERDTGTYASGVGLGLNVSQNLAKSMFGGKIKVRSIYQQGSQFWFSMNVYRESREAPDNSQREIPVEGVYHEVLNFTPLLQRKDFRNLYQLSDNKMDLKNFTNKFRILFADDDPVNHLVVEKYLNIFAHEVSSDKAYNGQEALQLITANAEQNIFYDLILMDCDMPVMNGLEASKKIRELVVQKIIKDTWIVAFTANVSVSDQRAYIDHGINDIWAKPISKIDFTNKVRQLIFKTH